MDGAPAASDDFLIAARVRRAHGVRGDLSIAVDTDRPEVVFARGRSLRLGDAAGDPVAGQVVIESYRPTPTGAILRLSGIGTREEADRLRGRTLLIESGEAAPPDPDEVHYRDLIGMSAHEGDRPIGVVEDVLELPTGELLVLRTPEGREVLIPFVKQIVVGFDVAARALSLDLPDGLLEI